MRSPMQAFPSLWPNPCTVHEAVVDVSGEKVGAESQGKPPHLDTPFPVQPPPNEAPYTALKLPPARLQSLQYVPPTIRPLARVCRGLRHPVRSVVFPKTL